MKPAHKKLSRMLGYCLTIGTVDAWEKFAIVAGVRLTADELESLAYFALAAVPTENAERLTAGLFRAVGGPLPPFLGGMDDAQFWASLASRNELKAYALAAFEAMPPKDQAAFFQHISTLEVTQ